MTQPDVYDLGIDGVDNNRAGYLDDFEDDDSSDYTYDADAEWEESKAQMNALFSLVIFPFVGRWLGRKLSFLVWSRWSYTSRSMDSSSFLTLQWLGAMKRIPQ
ncbi:hypothetical protein BC941DRAFT_509298 [Chlamydoabsidia padenii]|nr:hypothetical protein BC941DRAFT_509298 [Chlamydoabsidia padenii]